jgi:hypothetical protein
MQYVLFSVLVGACEYLEEVVEFQPIDAGGQKNFQLPERNQNRFVVVGL